MTTQLTTETASIVLVTTADTDILTAERALFDMPWGDGVSVYACNPVALEGDGESAESARQDLLAGGGFSSGGGSPPAGRQARIGRHLRSAG